MNVEEVLAKYSQPTTYEVQKGVRRRSDWSLLLDAGDVKFYSRDAYDWTKTLLIVFRAGVTENWCGWMINEAQARAMMNDFPTLYARLNAVNSLKRQGVGLAGVSGDDVWPIQEGEVEY